jgi:hypothetical protein
MTLSRRSLLDDTSWNEREIHHATTATTTTKVGTATTKRRVSSPAATESRINNQANLLDEVVDDEVMDQHHHRDPKNSVTMSMEMSLPSSFYQDTRMTQCRHHCMYPTTCFSNKGKVIGDEDGGDGDDAVIPPPLLLSAASLSTNTSSSRYAYDDGGGDDVDDFFQQAAYTQGADTGIMIPPKLHRQSTIRDGFDLAASIETFRSCLLEQQQQSDTRDCRCHGECMNPLFDNRDIDLYKMH